MALPLEPSEPKRKVQFTLAKFFKPEVEPQLALNDSRPQKRGRGRPPKELPLEVLQAEEQALRETEMERERMKAQMGVISNLKMKARHRLRGVAGGHGSNRLQPHQPRRRFEMSAAAKLSICEKANKARAEYATENEWMKDQMRKLSMT